MISHTRPKLKVYFEIDFPRKPAEETRSSLTVSTTNKSNSILATLYMCVCVSARAANCWLPNCRAVMAAFLPSNPSTSCCSFKFSNLPSKSHVFTLPALPLLCRRSNYHRHHLSLNRVTAALSAVDSPLKSSSDGQDEKSQPLLQVTGLTAVIAESKQEILKGVNLLVNEGEVSFKISVFNLNLISMKWKH